MSKTKRTIRKKLLGESGLYLLFGVLTTVVSYISFVLFLYLLGEEYVLTANTISFICAVTFAFVTNKAFVFESRNWKWTVLRKEIPSFLAARIASYFLEQGGLYLSQSVLHLDDKTLFGINGIMIAKLVLTVLVVIINWVLSKFIIFKKSVKD